MNTARHTTLTDLFALFDALLDQSRGRRLPVRPADKHDDAYPDDGANLADAKHQQAREES